MSFVGVNFQVAANTFNADRRLRVDGKLMAGQCGHTFDISQKISRRTQVGYLQ
jgi:hypothetical protein